MKQKKGFLLIGLVLAMGGPAWAGNPFLTDDPEPVDLGHGEVFVAGNAFQTSLGTYGTGQFEANYGAFPETQLHIILMGAFNMPNGTLATSGVGDTELGVKYRFFKEMESIPQFGTYLKLDLPTGNASQGLGTGTTRLMVPVWIQKSWGPWTTYGGGGYWFNWGPGGLGWVYLGWELQRDLSPVVTLGGEVFYQTPAVVGAQDTLSGDLGVIVNLDDHSHPMISIGRDLVNPVNTLFGYAAYLWTY